MTLSDTGHFAFFPKRCNKCRKLFWWEAYSKPYETRTNISMTLMGVEFPDAVQNIILCESCTNKMKEHKG